LVVNVVRSGMFISGKTDTDLAAYPFSVIGAPSKPSLRAF
jgi:hypothetical protein